MLITSNFYQYIPDSILQTKNVEEIQQLVESKKNGPTPKGDPITDLNISHAIELPPNLKLVSNNMNKKLN